MIIFKITEEINPHTGVSRIFDKDHFKNVKDKSRYQAKQQAPICNIPALKPHRDKCLCLMAKGYSILTSIKIIMMIYPKEFKNQSEKSLRSHLSRCAMYFSTHIDELIYIIGDYNLKCKEILSKIETKSSTNNTTTKISTMILEKNPEQVLDRINACFMEIHDLILTYPDRIFNLTDIENNIKEQQIKLSTCGNIDDLTETYQAVKSLYIRKEEFKKLKREDKLYKEAYMVKALKESGIDRAIKKYYKIMKNI